MTDTDTLLELKGVETFYGNIQALFGMSLHCRQGEVTTLLGRNGMGKTTTVGSIMGTVPARSGEIYFQSINLNYRKNRKSNLEKNNIDEKINFEILPL